MRDPMIGRAELVAALAALAGPRPVYHSEADFQHALAWTIHERHPAIEVRLERPVQLGARRGHVDLLLHCGGREAVIELKYWTRRTEPELLSVKGEDFLLATQGRQPLARYDFWKDIERTERLITDGQASGGHLIALANWPGYWSTGRPRGAIDEAFRIQDGREVHGTLAWSSQAGAGTIRGRETPIALRGRYVTRWDRYSLQVGVPGGEFRYLLLDIGVALAGTIDHTSA